VILVDSNIPMYLIGVDHPHKFDSQRLIERFLRERQRLISDAEVLQEILHRYTFIGRHRFIQPAFDALHGIVDEVLPVDQEVMELAKQIVLTRTELSARDAVHLAVMQHHGIERILSFDSGFDQFPGITRLS
jgi:hypothetical protein